MSSLLIDQVQKNTINVAEIKTDIQHMKSSLDKVELQVSNHIPHQIDALEDSFYKFQIATSRWLIGILVSILTLAIGILLNIAVK